MGRSFARRRLRCSQRKPQSTAVRCACAHATARSCCHRETHHVAAMLVHGQSIDVLTEAATREMGTDELELNLFLRGASTARGTEHQRKALSDIAVGTAPRLHRCEVCSGERIGPALPVIRYNPAGDYPCMRNPCPACFGDLRVCADCSKTCACVHPTGPQYF